MPDVKPRRAPSRAAYALPALFTAGNIFLGFLSMLRTFQGALLVSTNLAAAADNFAVAAKTIGIAVLLDGLDGRIARMTNTTSSFGAELDSLADIISFGIAPAFLAFAWGVQFVSPGNAPWAADHLQRAGKFIAFLFLVCGAARLARFNVQKNPMPKNPGRPHRKYFVGLPIPAGAGMIAAVAYAFDSYPITTLPWSMAWLALVALVSFLMVSTWRYHSFKDLNFSRPLSSLVVIALAGLIFLIWNYSQPVLLAIASAYVASGIFIRVGGIMRRHLRPAPPRQPEHQIG